MRQSIDFNIKIPTHLSVLANLPNVRCTTCSTTSVYLKNHSHNFFNAIPYFYDKNNSKNSAESSLFIEKQFEFREKALMKSSNYIISTLIEKCFKGIFNLLQYFWCNYKFSSFQVSSSQIEYLKIINQSGATMIYSSCIDSCSSLLSLIFTFNHLNVRTPVFIVQRSMLSRWIPTLILDALGIYKFDATAQSQEMFQQLLAVCISKKTPIFLCFYKNVTCKWGSGVLQSLISATGDRVKYPDISFIPIGFAADTQLVNSKRYMRFTVGFNLSLKNMLNAYSFSQIAPKDQSDQDYARQSNFILQHLLLESIELKPFEISSLILYTLIAVDCSISLYSLTSKLNELLVKLHDENRQLIYFDFKQLQTGLELKQPLEKLVSEGLIITRNNFYFLNKCIITKSLSRASPIFDSFYSNAFVALSIMSVINQQAQFSQIFSFATEFTVSVEKIEQVYHKIASIFSLLWISRPCAEKDYLLHKSINQFVCDGLIKPKNSQNSRRRLIGYDESDGEIEKQSSEFITSFVSYQQIYISCRYLQYFINFVYQILIIIYNSEQTSFSKSHLIQKLKLREDIDDKIMNSTLKFLVDGKIIQIKSETSFELIDRPLLMSEGLSWIIQWQNIFTYHLPLSA